MSRKRTGADVENYRHDKAKRINIPTAENQSLVPDDEKALKVLRYPRNPDLDPQLVWRGKDAEDGAPLEVAAPPIYIQEKIHPRALIEDLRKQSARRKNERAEQTDLFHDFNGLPDGWVEDAAASYYHDEGRWQNRMILGDSMLVMGSLAEREALRGKVQCIYFDPPYGIKFNSNWQPSTKSREVKDGKEESVSREPEVVRAFRDTWKDEIHSYLSYLRDRLTVARDLLSETGSIFVQIGDENVHRVRAVMDEVLGDKNFVAEIIVAKTTGATADLLPPVCDYVLWAAKRREAVRYRQLFSRKMAGEVGATGYTKLRLPNGSIRPLGIAERDDPSLIPKGSRILATGDLTSQRPPGDFPVEFNGRIFRPIKGYWKTGVPGFKKIIRADRVNATSGGRLSYIRYIEDFPAYPITNIWTDTVGQNQFGGDKLYVVQTANKIVERCILMSSDPGDLVLDPTCGSGTTAYVAEQWGRRWITIDTSRVALTLARARLMGARYDYYLLANSEAGATEEAKLSGKAPNEGPWNGDIRHGFVYERAPHVTLKSIANNAEIDVIWDRYQPKLEQLRARLNASLKMQWDERQVPRELDSKWPERARVDHAAWWELRRERQKEIDASIARNADVELLYDRPFKAKGVVRVAGPFTVESLSPHRVLPLEEDPYLAEILGTDEFPSPLAGEGLGVRGPAAQAAADAAIPLHDRFVPNRLKPWDDRPGVATPGRSGGRDRAPLGLEPWMSLIRPPFAPVLNR